MNGAINTIPYCSFSNSEPDYKIAPFVVGLGTVASWGTKRFLHNRFPPRK